MQNRIYKLIKVVPLSESQQKLLELIKVKKHKHNKMILGGFVCFNCNKMNKTVNKLWKSDITSSALALIHKCENCGHTTYRYVTVSGHSLDIVTKDNMLMVIPDDKPSKTYWKDIHLKGDLRELRTIRIIKLANIF
jgi:hypothetical protein